MAQAPDPTTVALTGALPAILIVGLLLAFPVSASLLLVYHRAVLRSMRARVNPPGGQPGTPEDTEVPTQPATSDLDIAVLDRPSATAVGAVAGSLLIDATRAPWRAAAIYAVAGSGYALVMAAAFLTATGIEFFPLRFLFLFWIHAWPIVLTVNKVAAPIHRTRLIAAASYFLILTALGAIGVARSPALTWSQIVVLWLVTNLPVTVALELFPNRRVRAVGPLVLTFMMLAVTGSNFALSAVGSDEGLLHAVADLGARLGLGAAGIFVGLIALGFIVFGLVGWLALHWISRRYERKKVSDESITLDAIWLFFAVWHALGLTFEGPLWILSGLGAFLTYKAVAWAGFARLNGKSRAARNAPRLLLLRVFALGKRGERLFDTLAAHWRHVGSLQLIAGPDLATSTIEPHEFLDFLRGRLARRFIDGPAALDLRIREMDLNPDHDGRFRVNDFFCYDDTWKLVLARLVSHSDAVLMDLRGFSRRNTGVVFEINELMNLVPLYRVVIAIDDTTDVQFLRDTLQQSWSRLRPMSPNRRHESNTLHLLQLARSGSSPLGLLLRSLCAAARAPTRAAA